MSMKRKRIISILLSLAMVIGLMPGMSLTAYAADNYVTINQADFYNQNYATRNGVTVTVTGHSGEYEYDNFSIFGPGTITTTSGNITEIIVMGGNVNISGTDWTYGRWNGYAPSVSFDGNVEKLYSITVTIAPPVAVTDVTLDKTDTQTIDVGGSVAFTAIIAPDGATDKKVKWSTTSGVTLYSDAACTAGNEVGTDATSTLTVYAKGKTEGSATVTATSNSDNTKSASCAVTVVPAHTHAAGTPVEGITFQPWTSSDGLPNTEGNYYLTEDVTISSAWEVPAGVTSLCLNGHGIKFNGTDIGINKTLNLYDCDTSTKHSFTVSDGLATIDDTFNENNQTFTGGYITRGNNSSNGGGVRAYGTFNMYGGTIIGNNNGNNGGGVNVASGARFNMNGGSIMYNTASCSGGGVNTVDTFNMDEGSIENNTAGVDGGGVNIGKNGKLNMTGGSITDNIANADDNKDGGGVWVSSEGQFKVSGAPKITRNTTKNATKNVFLASTSEITVNGPLKGEGDSKVGVTMKTPGVFTNEWNAIMGSTANPADYFFSDNSDYGVTLTTGDNPEAQLLRCYPLKYDSNGGSGSMDPQSIFEGETFKFPACGFIAQQGMAFDHWEMSGVDSSSSNVNPQNELVNGIFKPGSTVVIASNCASDGVITVTAHWKEMATVTKAPEAINPTYNGAAQELVTAGTAQNGTIKYATGSNTAPTTEWSENIPTGTDAGTYYVWYKAVGDATYADSDPKCVTATIKSRHNTPTAAERVANEIKALSDPVTLADKEKVDKAKAAYDALPESQQKQVPDYLVQKLNKAIDIIAVLLVSDQIAGLPEPVTLDDEAAVDAAVEAYLALTDSQKEIFSEMDLQKLDEAVATIANLQFEADKQSAAGITVKMGKVKNLKGGKVQIPLGKPHINAAKGKAASAFTAPEAAGIDGFIIQYSTDKKFKKKVKTKTITDPTAKSATIKHLKKGKTYYFRVCTYTKVTNSVSGDTATVKGKWSPKKKVKITK